MPSKMLQTKIHPTLNHEVRSGADRRNWLFSWAYSAQTMQCTSPPNLTHKRHILGCWLVPETIPIAPNCAVWAVALSQTPPRKYLFVAVFGTCKTPGQKFGNVHRCTHADTDSRLLFQKRLKSVQDKWPKVRVVLLTKHVLASLGATPGAIFPEFLCECASWPLTYTPSFIQIRSGLGKYNHDPQSECNIGSLCPITKTQRHTPVLLISMISHWWAKQNDVRETTVARDTTPWYIRI